MGNDSKNASVELQQQYYLAKLLLQKYETFHPFFEMQMQYYTVACCNISVGGEVKLDVGSKVITYDIKTEKEYKKENGKFVKVKRTSIKPAKYKKECKQALLNLESWTRDLLWGDGTTVKVYVDGKLIE